MRRPPLHRSLFRAALAFTALAAAALCPVGGGAQTVDDAIPLEHRVKAAYIFNFARFVSWPDSADPAATPPSQEPIAIGIIGRDRFTASLRHALQGLAVGQRPIVVQQVHGLDPAPEVHLLYIARSEDERIAHIIRTYRNRSTLTVSETRRFLQQGGMVRLETDNDQIHFTVNIQAIERAGMKASSQMLQYARNVNE